MKIVTVTIITAITTHGNLSYGQTKLGDLIDYAIGHSRDVKKAELQREESTYKHKETMGHGLPQAEAAASYSKMGLPAINITPEMAAMIPQETQPLLAQLSGADAIYMASAGIQVTQLIYNQAYWTGLKTTKKAEELYSLLKNNTEEEVVEEVATNYYQALSLSYQLNTLEKSLKNLREIYRIVELNYQNDFVKQNDVNRLKVSITNLQVSEQTLENAVSIQLNYIKALAGMPADSVLTLDTTLTENFVNEQLLSTEFVPENVTAYQLLQKQGEVAGQNIKLAKAEYSPTLAVYGKLNYSSYSFKSNLDKLSNMNTIGLQLKAPVFTSGVNHAKVKQAQLQKLQADETMLKTKDLLQVDFSNALSGYKTAYKLLEVQKENRELALKVYDQTSLEYKEGMASMADVLNVNSDYLQAENSYNQQILKCKLAGIKMMKSSGTIKQLMNNN